MSTNKTANYQLHSWTAGDKFLRTEMNENFTKLDAAARVVVGSYTGDGEATRQINLGFQPKAVLVARSNGGITGSYECYGGLAAPGQEVIFDIMTALTVTATGFQVYRATSGSRSVQSNSSALKFYYLAIR